MHEAHSARRLPLVAALVLVVAGCGAWDKEGRNARAMAPQPAASSSIDARPAPPVAAVAPRAHPGPPSARAKKPSPPPAPNPEDVAQAKKLMAMGQALYRKGDYDRAEQVLKQAMTLYPFLADANVTLGKIFLIRGAATRDPALIDSARLMFEMARAQNGNGSREAEVLLELFRAVPE